MGGGAWIVVSHSMTHTPDVVSYPVSMATSGQVALAVIACGVMLACGVFLVMNVVHRERR